MWNDLIILFFYSINYTNSLNFFLKKKLCIYLCMCVCTWANNGWLNGCWIGGGENERC